MVRGIVKHDYGIAPPVCVEAGQVGNHLYQDELDGVAVVGTQVDAVDELAPAAHTRNDVHSGQPHAMGAVALLALSEPAHPPTLCGVQHALVNVEDPFSLSEVLDVYGCSILSLQLCGVQIVPVGDGCCPLVAHAQHLSHVLGDHLPCDLEVDF